jgi:hypothetical protein
MNSVSICNSEEFYHIKQNASKQLLDKNNKKNKNVDIKKNTKNVYVTQNKGKLLTSKDYAKKSKNNLMNTFNSFSTFNYIGKEEDQLDFDLSLDDIEKSFNEDSLDLLKYNQIEDNYDDYKPPLYEEEQLQFELTMEEIEDSFHKLSLDLFYYNQLDHDINNINIEAQAYENIVELEFEYSEEE